MAALPQQESSQLVILELLAIDRWSCLGFELAEGFSCSIPIGQTGLG
jgi:hypothetical protein